MKSLVENKKKCIITLFIFLSLLGLTIYTVTKDLDFATIAPLMKEVNLLYLFLGIGVMLGFIACEACNIKIILGSLSQKIPFGRCLKYSFVGFYFSSITPSASGGQPAQVYYMKRDDIPLSLSSLTLLSILMVYQGVILLFSAFMFLWKAPFILGQAAAIVPLLLFGVIMNVAMFCFMIAIFVAAPKVSRFLIWCGRLFAKVHLVKDLAAFENTVAKQIAEYQGGAAYLRQHPLVLTKVALMTILQLICLFMVPYLIYRSLHFQSFGFWDFIAIQAMLTISVDFLPLPGGVGASENVFLVLYRIFYPAQLLLPAMLLSRGVSFYAILLLSGAITMFISLHRRKKEVPTLSHAKPSLKETPVIQG